MIRSIFLDTNIILDLLGERHPFYTPVAQIATLADEKKIKMYATPLSFATVNYFLTKFENSQIAIEKLRKFKVLCNTSKLDNTILDKALNSEFKDFEDALQYFAAIESNCEIIITRNETDFKLSTIPIMNANEFLSVI
jgi:predicted nucleic acid-binding protein